LCAAATPIGANSTYHAKLRILRLAHPGWATVTLEADLAHPGGSDTYLVILPGDAADGSGRRLGHNNAPHRHPRSG